MNLSRVKVWSAEILYASDLNAEFNNILNHELDDSDIKAGADIQVSKLLAGTNGQILKIVAGVATWVAP